MRRLRLWLNEPVLDRVANEGCIVRQSQLLEDPPAVGADRARAEKHLRGDLVDMLARRYQSHHPVFAIGEQVVRRLLSALGEIGSKLLREGGLTYLPPPTTLRMAPVRSSLALPLLMNPAPPALSTWPACASSGRKLSTRTGRPGYCRLTSLTRSTPLQPGIA